MSKYAGKLMTLGASSGYSVQFPASNAVYLEAAWNAAYTLGANNFTIEAWIYPTNDLTLNGIFANSTSTTTPGQFVVRRNASNRLEAVITIGTAQTLTGTTTLLPINTWSHVAVVRNGTTLYLYVNGVQDATTLTGLGTITGTGQVLRVGIQQALVNAFSGYISNTRLVVGTAVYTANFAPPMALQAITNTVFLSCNDSMIKDASTINAAITVVNTTSLYSQVVPFTPFLSLTPDSANPALGVAQSGGVFTMQEMANYAASGAMPMYDPGFSSTLTKITGVGINAQNNSAFVATSPTPLTATSTSSSIQFNTLTVGGVVIGSFAVGMTITGSGILSGTLIVGYGTGTGGAGTYILSTYQATLLSSVSITGTGGYYVTRTGTVTQGAFNPYQTVGNFSNSFDGSSYLTTPAGLNAAMGSGFAGHKYTIEAFIYPTASSAGPTGPIGVIGSSAAVSANGRWAFGYNSIATNTSGRAMFMYTSAPAAENFLLGSANNIVLNQWNHIAITIDSTTSTASVITMFVGGRVVLTQTVDLSTQTTFYSTPTIGGSYGTSVAAFVGNISNLRIIYGTLLYTGTFTPPTAPLPNTGTGTPSTIFLACQASRFMDASNNNYTIGVSGNPNTTPFSPFSKLSYEGGREGGSAYFDGSASYLNFAAPTNLIVSGFNQCALAFWVYCAVDTTTTQYIYDGRDAAGMNSITVYISGGTIRFATAGVDRIASGTITARQWYYVAVSRASSGGTSYDVRLYVNGVMQGSAYADGSLYTLGVNRPVLGCSGVTAGTSPLTGYLADITFINGSSFGPVTTIPVPIAPAAAITGTVLLMSFANAGIYDATRIVDINTVGASNSNVTAKFNNDPLLNGSILIPNAGSLTLSAPTGASGLTNLIPTLGNFTVETWVNVTNFNATNPTIIFLNGNSTDFAAVRVVLNSAGTVTLMVSTSGSTWAINTTSTATPITLNVWNHIAVVRVDTNFILFVNGQAIVTSTTVTTVTALLAASFCRLGGVPTTANAATFYIQDFRITRGARYVASYPRPVALLPTM